MWPQLDAAALLNHSFTPYHAPQVLVSLVACYALRAAGRMRFGPLTWRGARRAAPLAACWWLYVVSGVTALRYLNVPMYSVLRRSTTLLVVAGEAALFSKRPSRRSLAALLLMVGGAAAAGISDLTFSAPGYAWVAVCVVSTAAYLLLIKKLQDGTGATGCKLCSVPSSSKLQPPSALSPRRCCRFPPPRPSPPIVQAWTSTACCCITTS